MDHSDGRDGHGRYMVLNGSYFEGDDNSAREGVLTSRQFRTTVHTQCLEIWSNIHSEKYVTLVFEIIV